MSLFFLKEGVDKVNTLPGIVSCTRPLKGVSPVWPAVFSLTKRTIKQTLKIQEGVRVCVTDRNDWSSVKPEAPFCIQVSGGVHQINEFQPSFSQLDIQHQVGSGVIAQPQLV